MTTNRKVWKTLTLLMFIQCSTQLSALTGPAKAAGSMVILSHTGYLDSLGNYHVVGEVQNIGTNAVNFIQVTATFLDSQGFVIDSRFDLTMLYVLLPGRNSPFDIALLDVAESNRVSDYSLSVTYQETSPLPMKLEILSHSSFVDAEGNMHIIGNLKNLGDEKLLDGKVVATYYDASSRVVAAALVSFVTELIGDINPNQTVLFEVKLEKERTQYVRTYAVVAESYQYVMITEFPEHLLLSFLIISACALMVLKLRKERMCS